MKIICNLLMALSVVLSMSIAQAQQPGTGERKPQAVKDCSKVQNPEKRARCIALERAMEKCKHLKGNAHRSCVKEATPKREN